MASDATRYREAVERQGLSETHLQVIEWVSPGAKVLEVGCASGYIGKILIEQKGCSVTGIELDRGAAVEARANGLSVVEGSLEDASFRETILDKFDFVLATDVLEHLRTPEVVLEHFKRWLVPGGHAIIAVPNVATWQIRGQLFFSGDFEYKETGILDRTHVHFFTWNTLHDLVKRQGWTITDTMSEWTLPVGKDILVEAPQDARAYLERIGAAGPVGKLAHTMFGGLTDLLETGGKAIANKIFNRWPNACAAHIALMLTPGPEA
jgi:methionine biosynthesis protein MetW